MKLTPRAKKVLQLLLETEQKMTMQELADRMGVSKRTVQREMDDVSGFLEKAGIRLIIKMGSGLWLEEDMQKRRELLSELQQEEIYDAGNKEERRKRLILEILKEKELKKLSYYSCKFQVSESTVSGDVEVIANWFARYGIKIVRKAGNGIEIQGTESDYRRAIRTFIEENINTDFLKEVYEKETISDFSEQCRCGEIGKIFQNDLLRQVIECVTACEGELLDDLTETAFSGLIIHITIAMNRILRGDIIEEIPDWEKETHEDEDYERAVRLTKALEEKFQMDIPNVETFYIYLHLKGSKHEKIQWKEQKIQEKEHQKMLRLVNEMIDTFDPKDAWLYKQDNEFIQGLLAHLQPTVIRLLYHMKIQNPVLDTVKQEYGDVFERCIKVSKVLEKHLGEEVPEDEIGFLAIHFGAAKVRLESQRKKIRPVQLGVVCASGIGISRLMSSKLKQVFRDRIQIHVYGKRDINPYITAKTDFFVSSIPMEKTEIPIIYVNPFLNEKDMESIQKMVYEYERMPEKKQEEDTFSLQLEQINLITAQINAVVKYMDIFKVRKNISFEELLTTIGEHMSPYSDRRELIVNDIRSREKLASQIFAEFGFALLHARSEGVVRPGLSVCLPEEEMFTNPYFKKIKVVLVMLIPEDENLDINGEILGYLSNLLLEEDEFLATLEKGNKKEIQSMISGYLKKFFQEYLERVK